MALRHNVGEQDIISVMNQFARATLDPTLLGSALTASAELIGAVGCSLEFADLKTGEASMECPVPFEANALQLYEERIFQISPRVANALAAPVGQLVDDRHLLPEDDPHTPEFLDRLSATSTRYIQGARLLNEGGHVAFYGAHFAERHGPHQDWQGQINQLLMPHIINFVHVGRALSEQRLRGNLVNQQHLNTNKAFALLDGRGRIVEASVGFEGALRDCGLLAIRDRQLAARYAVHRSKVESFLNAALNPHLRLESPQPIRLASTDRPKGIVLRAVPLTPGDNLFDMFLPVALITIRDLDQPDQVRSRELAALFDLTPREAEIAALIGEGQTVAGAAQSAGIARYTARQHLKAIFGKIGISRQAELVALVTKLQ